MSSLKQGSKETQEDAAATLSLLSSCDSNMQPIGRAGALKPLIDVLDDDDASAFNTVSNRKQNQGFTRRGCFHTYQKGQSCSLG